MVAISAAASAIAPSLGSRAARATPRPRPAAPRGAAVAPAPNAPRRRVVARGGELSWDEADAELLSLECVPRAPRSAARPAPPERAPFAARRNPRGSAAVASPSIRFGRRAVLFLADHLRVGRQANRRASFFSRRRRSRLHSSSFFPSLQKDPVAETPLPLSSPPGPFPPSSPASATSTRPSRSPSPTRTRRRFACARPTAPASCATSPRR